MMEKLQHTCARLAGARREACLKPHFVKWVFALIFSITCGARAELQFDLFPGYGGVLREGSWNPVACEVFNDGPSFQGVVELSTGQFGGDHMHRYEIELPSNTRKRFQFTVFNNSRYPSFSAKLLDEKRKTRAELNLGQSRTAPWNGVLFGSMPRTISGLPGFPDIGDNSPEQYARVVRVNLEHFPENPIALNSLDAIYLNPGVAVEFSQKQIESLLSWVHSGGHLILSLESALEINALPWLQSVCPIRVEGVENRKIGGTLHRWLRIRPTQLPSRLGGRSASVSATGADEARVQRFYGEMDLDGALLTGSSPFAGLSEDPEFAVAETPVVMGSLREDARSLLSIGQDSLLAARRVGRGQATAICFGTEREPFRSWTHKDWFWAKLLEVPEFHLSNQRVQNFASQSLDGVFGAMIDSRQVQKLPVKWLLAILAAYLIVIGPLDHYWLKKINRQILTWITFPIYVAFFSFLIYYIGYKLRAGETEWNELQIVDVLPKGGGAEFQGHSFFSIYSPVNARYDIASPFEHAALRGEFEGLWGSGQGGGQSAFTQREEGFDAEVYVPVWSSQLYVCDWVASGDSPVTALLQFDQTGWRVEVENHLDRTLNPARLFWGESYYDLGALEAQAKRTIALNDLNRQQTRNFVLQHAGRFQSAIQGRRSSVGRTSSGQLNDPQNQTMAASFCGFQQAGPQGQPSFIYPRGFGLAETGDRGVPILMAWDEGKTCVETIKRFPAKRESYDTLYRLAVSIESNNASTK